jgi:Xaa-Pro aminopeptidase
MQQMKSVLIIAASTDATMRYASRLFISDAFILLDTGVRRYLLVSALEYGVAKRALRQEKKTSVILWDKYADSLRKPNKRVRRRRKGSSSLALLAAAFLKEKRIRRVVMPRSTWASVVDTLRHEKVRVDIAQTPLYAQRLIKSKEELRAILHVRDATIAAMRRCLGILKRSRVAKDKTLVWGERKVTSESLRLEARRVLLDYACEAPELIISHGAQTATPHDNGSGPIRAGEPIVLDFFPRSMETGYWFDMTRTVCKGEPDERLQKLYDAVREAQQAALVNIKAGMPAKESARAAQKVFRKRKYTTSDEEGFIHSLGHGLGLEIHEPPSLSPKSDERFKAGMVIAIEPGLYYKKIGGVRIEDTVLVTKNGYRNLTPMGKRLEL